MKISNVTLKYFEEDRCFQTSYIKDDRLVCGIFKGENEYMKSLNERFPNLPFKDQAKADIKEKLIYEMNHCGNPDLTIELINELVQSASICDYPNN